MIKLLIIDDDLVIRKILQKALSNHKYEIIVAKNGEEGISAAQEHEPALIICDWMMPGIDGLEVCRQVKANQHLSTTFFILLTSKGEVKDRIKGLDNGADDFLSKPIDVEELTARVRAGLRLYQMNQNLREQNKIIENQKALIEAELNEAANYVRSLLPSPMEHPFRIETVFVPSSQLGGDAFDYFWLDENHLAMYLLDTSGHGIGTALLSVSVLNWLRSQRGKDLDLAQPAEVLKQLNQTFQMADHNDKYFTIWYGIYSRSSQTLTYANGGHPPGILITPESKYSLSATGLPVGFFADSSYQQKSLTVPENSILYVLSDGIFEFNLVTGNLWGMQGFTDLVTNDYQLQKIKSLDKLLAEINHLNMTGTFADDLSMIAISFSNSFYGCFS